MMLFETICVAIADFSLGLPSTALVSEFSGSNSQLSSTQLQGVAFEKVVMKMLLGVERFAVGQRTPAAFSGLMASPSRTRETVRSTFL